MKYFLSFILLILSLTVIAAPNNWEGRELVNFSLQDQTGKLQTNKDFLGKWLVLYFYPKDKTPGCTVEAQHFTDDYSQYKKLGAEIVGVSLDGVESHKAFADTYKMPFKLLADAKSQLSEAMKVKNYFPWPHASRQTFLVNPQGVIVKHFKSVDPKTHSKQLINELKKRIQVKKQRKPHTTVK